MLESLTRYLRSALHRSRKSGTTMQQEIELIRDYLDIIQMRMGDRLKYEIDISDNLLNIRFPPMLLQPLVENAIKHGLEPSEHGGTVKISGTINEPRTNLSVTDTGLGLRAETVSGFGLVNVRERLLSIYDNKAKLHIKENEPTGVIATIEIPNEAN